MKITINDLKTTSARLDQIKSFHPFISLHSNLNRMSGELDYYFLCMNFLDYLVNEGKLKNRDIPRSEINEYVEEFIKLTKLNVEDSYEKIAGNTINFLESANSKGEPFVMNYKNPLTREEVFFNMFLIEYVPRTKGYRITDTGLDFLISSKELHEESRVTVGLIIFQKQIEGNYFNNALITIKNLNLEVLRKLEKKQRLLEKLAFESVGIAKEYEKYANEILSQLEEEDGLLKTVNAFLSEAIDNIESFKEYKGKKITEDDFEVLVQIRLEFELSLRNHARLLRSFTDLGGEIDVLMENRLSSIFMDTFGFKEFLEDTIRNNRSLQVLAEGMQPLLMPKQLKEFHLLKIYEPHSNIVAKEKEVVSDVIPNEEVEFKEFEDIALERQSRSFEVFFILLLKLLKEHDEFDMEMYLDALTDYAGAELSMHVDFNSFFIELSKIGELEGHELRVAFKVPVRSEDREVAAIEVAMKFVIEKTNIGELINYFTIENIPDELIYTDPNGGEESYISNMIFRKGESKWI